eukprot:5728816-Pleurochrysis_carterae.AAC.2
MHTLAPQRPSFQLPPPLLFSRPLAVSTSLCPSPAVFAGTFFYALEVRGGPLSCTHTRGQVSKRPGS